MNMNLGHVEVACHEAKWRREQFVALADIERLRIEASGGIRAVDRFLTRLGRRVIALGRRIEAAGDSSIGQQARLPHPV
jgi:hypothetical protein